ncbi:hypothetical protein QX201_004438 [Fusarium graminearum]
MGWNLRCIILTALNSNDLRVEKNGQIRIIGVHPVHDRQCGTVGTLSKLVRCWGVELRCNRHDAKLGLFQSMVELLFGKSNVLSTDFVSTITLGIDTIPWIIVGQVLVSICVAPFLEILHNLRREVSIEGLVANLWNPSAPEISTAADTIDRPTDIAVRGIGQLNFGFDSVINTLVALWGVAGTAFVKGTRSVEDVGGEDDAAAFNQQHLFLLGSQVFSQWTSAKPTSYNDVVIGVEFGQETHDVCV